MVRGEVWKKNRIAAAVADSARRLAATLSGVVLADPWRAFVASGTKKPPCHKTLAEEAWPPSSASVHRSASEAFPYCSSSCPNHRVVGVMAPHGKY